jgi:nucleotide-binding universal stress UspA family protein
MKNVLMLAHDDAGQEARMQAALDITRAVNGHLTCLDVTAIPLAMGDALATAVEAGTFVADLIAQPEFRRRMEARLTREDVSWSWIEGTGTLADALAQHAGLADLIVVSRKLDSARSPDTRRIASEVVVSSGRAIVAVPERPLGFNVAGRALVAWDGSDEAMNALQAAVPLLALAGRVEIVHVDDGGAGASAAEAAAYLSRHDIKAMIITQGPVARASVDVLLAQLKIDQADYVVMGGFGHSRAIETMFGGVSRRMLGESPIPVVMAH